MRRQAPLLSDVDPARGAGATSARVTMRWYVLLIAGGSLIAAGAVAPRSLIILARDGPIVAGILLAALGFGSVLMQLIGLHDAPPRWRWLGGLALGLGGLSLLVLGLGAAGLLHRALWLALLVLMALGGVRAFVRLLRRQQDMTTASLADAPAARGLCALWLVVIPFAALSLVAATMPPGILWPAEGNGYDVLEYHLAAPREYFEAGAIIYLPHNLYSNFPFNVEMLYLLAMILRGDPVAAAFTAQLLHLALGVLAVAAVWLGGREFGSSAGHFAGVLAATCPFLAYLSGLAYVEHGLIFFTAMSLAAMIRFARADQHGPGRWLVMSGACAGLACGCKYIAVPMVLVPQIIAGAVIGRRQTVSANRCAGIVLLAGLAAFSPWLLKNAAMTGNPVFPLARSVMPERAGVWDDDGAARWAEGHRPAPPDRPIARRFARLWSQVVTNTLFGPMIALSILSGIIAGAAGRRDAGTTACILMILASVVTWLSATHLVDRFAVTLIPPCAVIAGGVLGGVSSARQTARRLGIAAVAGLALLNGSRLLEIFSTAKIFEINRLRGEDGLRWFLDGELPATEHIARLNKIIRRGGKVLMVADARRFYHDHGTDYCVVFNRNPFAEEAAHRSPAELLDWLREQGYSHVFVHWNEMRRLRGSRYGFWKSVDEALFQRLMEAGLVRDEVFSIAPNVAGYGALFVVPPAPEARALSRRGRGRVSQATLRPGSLPESFGAGSASARSFVITRSNPLLALLALIG